MAVRMSEEVSTQVPADDFQALEEKVYRTIELYKSAREARTAAERDVTRLRQQLEEREEEVETLRREMVRLRKEREEIRGRVEKMLAQIETLTEEYHLLKRNCDVGSTEYLRRAQHLSNALDEVLEEKRKAG